LQNKESLQLADWSFRFNQLQFIQQGLIADFQAGGTLPLVASASTIKRRSTASDEARMAFFSKRRSRSLSIAQDKP
jgi:hypothetical protein